MIEISEKFRETLEDVLMKNNFQLYYVEQENIDNMTHLIIYIRKESMDDLVTLDECVLATQKINEFIDEFIDEEYILEVSSPGINRTLFTELQMKEVIGENIEVRLSKKVEEIEKKKYIGKLENVEAEEIIVDGITIPINAVKKIRYIGGN